MLSVKQKAKIQWRCRRGMLELDILLGRFCERGLDALTKEELNAFEHLLELPDPDLLACLMGVANPREFELVHVVARIQPYLAAR